MSYHMREAVLYNGMEWEMLYPRLAISKGDLLGLLAPTVVAEAGGVFRVKWTDNSGQASARPDDQQIAVVYDIDNPTSDVFFNLAERTATEAVLQLQSFMIGARVHCWIAFVSADQKKYATSNYMGKIQVLYGNAEASRKLGAFFWSG